MSKKKMMKTLAKGAKIGMATNLSKQLIAAVKKAVGPAWPAAFNTEPLKSLEPLICLGLLKLATDQFKLPGGKKVERAVEMALEGEVSFIVDTFMSSAQGASWTQIAAVAALYVSDGEEDDEYEEDDD